MAGPLTAAFAVTPPRKKLLRLASLALLLTAVACLDPVEAARADGDGLPSRPAPPAPDIAPERQVCTADDDCLLLYGVPGDTRQGLCCAGCAPPTALNLDTAANVAAWRRGLDCSQVVCGGWACQEKAEHGTAACEAGRCVRRGS